MTVTHSTVLFSLTVFTLQEDYAADAIAVLRQETEGKFQLNVEYKVKDLKPVRI